MAYVETGTFTSYADFYSTLAIFMAANGWAIDVSTSTRLHAHKGGCHIELWFSTYSYMMGCSGYDSGAESADQPGGPGVGTHNAIHLSSPSYYRFIATPNAIYAFVSGSYDAYAKYCLLAFGTIIEKVGGWTDGIFFSANGVQNIGAGSASGQTPLSSDSFGNFRVMINGDWTPLSIAGGACGQINVATTFYQKQPFVYNAGILPMPADIFMRDIGSTELLHPLGRLPDVLLFDGGSLYADGDTITIGAETWLCSNADPRNVGAPPIRYLFRVGV